MIVRRRKSNKKR